MGFEETRIEQLSDWMRGDGEPLTGTIGARQDVQLADLKQQSRSATRPRARCWCRRCTPSSGARAARVPLPRRDGR